MENSQAAGPGSASVATPAGSGAPARQASRVDRIDIRGLRYQVRHWGNPGAPVLFMLHGWMDASPTFQFVVEALQHDWHVIAPDWRGYGGSEFLRRPYWFPEYYADLDALLTHYSPAAPAALVGHSMGGAIASIYAAVRPERVQALAMLDFLGLKAGPADEAPAKIGEWLGEVNGDPARHRLRSYRDAGALARRLQSANPRLSAPRAAFLAAHTSQLLADGQLALACDAWHKIPSPFPYRVDEVLACWRRIEAPVLMLLAEAGYVNERFGNDPPELKRRLDCFARLTVQTVADAGHNLQHDQPAAVAAAIEDFFLPRRLAAG